ncbi:MAG: sigma-54 dependent transcriptional regulator [Bacillota bacterium]
MSGVKLLVIDDEADVGRFFRRLFLNKGYGIAVALNGKEAEKLIREESFDVAVVDMKLPDTDGLILLRQIKSAQPNCEVIIMTGYSTTRTAVKAIQYGAYDYLDKPFEDIDEVEKLIEQAAVTGISSRQGRPARAAWEPVTEKLGFRVGTSTAMRRLVDVAYKIAGKNINVLIQGETGTGKEVLAKFIHTASNRSDQIFIPVNCGALPENLLESELFGHEKGAFTGAGNIRRGIFEMANNGTLFLDEIGEASLSIQVKLLRVLETGEFLRVGGEKTIKTNVRVIAATNVDLEKAMGKKKFREDLFYRLDVVRLEVPPLRERHDDIIPLAEYFVHKFNPKLSIGENSLRLLSAYQWPGNMRELINTLSQAVALCDGKAILPVHLGKKLTGGEAAAPAISPDDAPDSSAKFLEEALAHYGTAGAINALDDDKLVNLAGLVREFTRNLESAMVKRGLIEPVSPTSLKDFESEAISRAMEHCQGNITRVARVLGIGRNTLYRKIKEHNLHNLKLK